MSLKLGDIFPNFEADTTIGPISFYEWASDSWAILFSHPADFTPVCTTELAKVAEIHDEFIQRGVKVIALSCDSVDVHKAWIKDIISYGKLDKFPYPIIADQDRKLAIQLGMLDPLERDCKGMPMTCRAVFIVDQNKKVRLSILYPATTGRNFGEIIRTIDSLKLTETRKVATPADWQNGQSCMILPTIPSSDIPQLFPKGHKLVEVPSKKEYIRITPQPE